MSIIDDPELEARLAAIDAEHRIRSAPEPRLYVPFIEAADDFERWVSTPEQRVYTGIAALDEAMRGLAPGELALLVGYNFSGKTTVAIEMLLFNNNRRVVVFSPDETRVALAVKLTAAVTGVGAKDMERQIGEGDERMRTLVRRTITNQFPTLAVCEDLLDVHEMGVYLDEVEAVWGAPAELVVFDYVELLQGFEAVPQQISALKGLGKRHDVPVLALHQTSRSAGADGRKMKLSSGSYGGEAQATFMIGVRRKKSEIIAKMKAVRESLESPSLSEGKHERLNRLLWDLETDLHRHEDTVTVSLVKSKRPPCDLVDDLDYQLVKDTGRIKPLSTGGF